MTIFKAEPRASFGVKCTCEQPHLRPWWYCELHGEVSQEETTGNFLPGSVYETAKRTLDETGNFVEAINTVIERCAKMCDVPAQKWTGGEVEKEAPMHAELIRELMKDVREKS